MRANGGDTLHEVLEPGGFVEERVGGGGGADALAGSNDGGPGFDGKVDVDGDVAVGFVVAEEGVVGGVGGEGFEVCGGVD